MNTTSNLHQAIKLIKARHTVEAREILVEILKSDPTNDEAWLWMSTVVDTAQLKKECLEEALKHNPHNPTAKQALKELQARTMANELEQAIRRIQMGDEVGGRNLLRAHLNTRPNDAEAWLWLSSVAITDKDRIEYLRQVLRIDPGNPSARKALARLTREASCASSSQAGYSTSAISSPRPRQVRAYHPKKWPLPDLIAGIVLIIGCIAIGVGTFMIDKNFNANANAFLEEGRRVNASVVGEVTYWRKGLREYCKVKYQFRVQGKLYEGSGTENDLKKCARAESSGVIAIEYLPSNPSNHRIPWEYPEDYAPANFRLLCGVPSFFGALFIAVYMIVGKPRGWRNGRYL